jgi:hypothetical protein
MIDAVGPFPNGHMRFGWRDVAAAAAAPAAEAGPRLKMGPPRQGTVAQGNIGVVTLSSKGLYRGK